MIRRTLLSLSATLAACGGGNDPAPPPATPLAAITADNALEVAKLAYGSAFDLIRVARIAGSFFEQPLPEPGQVSGPITRTIPGPNGGEALWTFTDRDGDSRYSSGDEWTISFAAYGDVGIVLDGALAFDQVAIQGDLSGITNWLFRARLRLLNLQVTKNNIVYPLQGDLVFGREERLTVDLLTLELPGTLMAGSDALAAGNAMGRNDYFNATIGMGLAAVGDVISPALGGRFAFSTPAILTGIQALPDPSGGRFTIRGGGGSALTLVPLDFSNCELELDADGDGAIDTTIATEWTVLNGA
jgi:hypothetical protein